MAKHILGAAFAGVIAVFCSAVGGAIEGFLFPVANGTAFHRVEPVDDTRISIVGTSVKQRECTFAGIEFRTDFGTVAAVTFEEGTRDRGAGVFEFGPWLVQMTPQQLERGRVVVFHRCHPLWLTETQWYP